MQETAFLLLTSGIISLYESFQYAKPSRKFTSLGTQSYLSYVYYDEKTNTTLLTHQKKEMFAFGKQNFNQFVFH